MRDLTGVDLDLAVVRQEEVIKFTLQGLLEKVENRRGIIAEIEEHSVQTGETLASVAAQAGMTWQQLAEFNWNTCDPNAITQHLRADVGCHKKTPDGKNYVFDSQDDPGVIYVPRQWTQTGLPVDQLHTIRVRGLAYGPRERRMRLFDGFGQPIPGALYAVEIGGAEVARGRADENGDFTLPDAAKTVCTVNWGGPDDAHASPTPFKDDPSGDDPLIFDRNWEFQYARDIYVDLDQPATTAASTTQSTTQKRLSNMGYSASKSLAENVTAFQRDAQQAVTGVLEQVIELVRDHHDDQCRPPEGGAQSPAIG